MIVKNRKLKIVILSLLCIVMLAGMAILPLTLRNASAESAENEYAAVDIIDGLDLTGAKIYIDADILFDLSSNNNLLTTSGGYSFKYDNGFKLDIVKDTTTILTPITPVNFSTIGYFVWECPADIGTVTHFNNDYADCIYALIIAEPGATEDPEPTPTPEAPGGPLDDISNFLSTADLASILILLGGAVVIAMVIGKLLR